MKKNETLEHAEGGTPLRLELKGGGTVDGDYVRHDDTAVVLSVDGEEQTIKRSGIKSVLLYIVNDRAA